jgi:hypothetical protein
MSHPDGKKALREISALVLDEIEQASDDREEYCQRSAEDWKIFTGDIPSKRFPFEHCANLHVPIAIENTMRVVSHVSSEVFGDWNNVFGVLPMGPQDDIIAQILSVHGNWQLRQQIPGFSRQMDSGMLQFFYIGDVS